MSLLVIGHSFVHRLEESLGDELRVTVSATYRDMTIKLQKVYFTTWNWRAYGRSFGRDVTICLDNVVAGNWTLVC